MSANKRILLILAAVALAVLVFFGFKLLGPPSLDGVWLTDDGDRISITGGNWLVNGEPGRCSILSDSKISITPPGGDSVIATYYIDKDVLVLMPEDDYPTICVRAKTAPKWIFNAWEY